MTVRQRDICEGGGMTAQSLPVVDMEGRVKCPECQLPVKRNASGTIRRHENHRQPPKVLLSGGELTEMANAATDLKMKLRHYLDVSKDPKFRRLWEHALTLETQLTKLAADQQWFTAKVVLQAVQLGPDVE